MNEDKQTPETPVPESRAPEAQTPPETFPPQSMPSRPAGSKKPLLIAAAIAVVLLVLAAVGLSIVSKKSTSSGNTAITAPVGLVAKIDISNQGFSPDSLRVVPGTTVEWKNTDSVSHTLSGEDIGTENVVAAGGTFTYLFGQAGDYTVDDGPYHLVVTVRDEE